MSKLLKSLMLVLLAFVLCIIPNAFAEDGLSIKSITLDSKSDNTTINGDATAEGLVVTFNLKFLATGNFAKYKVELENTSDEDFEVNKDTTYSDSGYIKYEFSFDDDSSIVSKKTTKIMYITVTYDKEVPIDELDADGGYTENNEMAVEIAERSNPKTGSTAVKVGLLLLLAVVAAFSLLASKKSKISKTMIMMFALLVVVIPTTIYAAKKVELKISTAVEVNNNCVIFTKDLNYSCTSDDYVGGRPDRLFDKFGDGENTDSSLSLSYSCSEDGYDTISYEFKGEKTWRELFEVYYDAFLSDDYKESYPFEDYLVDSLEGLYNDSEGENPVTFDDILVNNKVYYYVPR